MTQKGDNGFTHFYYALNGRPWIYYYIIWNDFFRKRSLDFPFRQVTDLIVQPFSITIANIIGLIRAVCLRSSIWQELTVQTNVFKAILEGFLLVWYKGIVLNLAFISELNGQYVGFLRVGLNSNRVARSAQLYSWKFWNGPCWPKMSLVFRENHSITWYKSHIISSVKIFYQ